MIWANPNLFIPASWLTVLCSCVLTSLQQVQWLKNTQRCRKWLMDCLGCTQISHHSRMKNPLFLYGTLVYPRWHKPSLRTVSSRGSSTTSGLRGRRVVQPQATSRRWPKPWLPFSLCHRPTHTHTHTPTTTGHPPIPSLALSGTIAVSNPSGNGSC